MRGAVSDNLRSEIDDLLEQINSHQLRLSHSYARLGGMLSEVEKSKEWVNWGFETFPRYMAYVGEKIDRRKSQMYAVLSVATDLLPYLTEEKLEAIGITKAHELRRFVNTSGLRPDVMLAGGDVQLMEFAADPKVTAAQLRVEVNKLLHQEEEPQGLWFDLGGCYFTLEEKRTWERAVELGKRMAEVTSSTSEHGQLKAALLLMAQEVFGSWEPELMSA
jgi:hypothetical protein